MIPDITRILHNHISSLQSANPANIKATPLGSHSKGSSTCEATNLEAQREESQGLSLEGSRKWRNTRKPNQLVSPPRPSREDPEASPSSNPMEAQIQQLAANNQAMQEQVNMLHGTIQVFLSRLPPTAQESPSPEHPEQRDAPTEAVQVPPTTTVTPQFGPKGRTES